MEQLSIASAAQSIAIGSGTQADSIGSTAHHVIRDGKPWYPVMDEFRYSRYPAAE